MRTNQFHSSSHPGGHVAAAFAAILLLAASGLVQAEPPTGIYALGSGRDNPLTPQDERLAGIRSYDFVSGFTLRVFWNDLEPGPGQYDFSVIDAAIQRVAAIGRGLNLEILINDEPQYVLNGASSTYIDHRGGVNPVPWDPFAQQRQAALYAALGNHVVTGVGAAHPLSQDATLKSVDAAPAGLNYGVRDLNSGIRNNPGYTQQRYVDAVVNGVNASATAFPNDTNYLAFFAFTDAQPGVPVDEQIIDRLAPAYNGPGQTKLAFFVENLSDNGPLPTPNGMGTGSNLAEWAALGGDTMMQALDSWLVHDADRDLQLLSRNPATGIALANEAYGTRFFELYISDLDGAANGALDALGRPIVNDLRSWNDVLTSPDADFNEDGIVHGVDLDLWTDGFSTPAGATHRQGDADGDQDVDGRDFLFWQLQADGSPLFSATAGVPEPAAIILALLLLAAMSLWQRGIPMRRNIIPSWRH